MIIKIIENSTYDFGNDDKDTDQNDSNKEITITLTMKIDRDNNGDSLRFLR